MAARAHRAFLRAAAAALRDAGGLATNSTKAPVMRFLNRLFGVPPALQVLASDLFASCLREVSGLPSCLSPRE